MKPNPTPESSHPLLELFRYGHLPKKVHQLMFWAGLVAAGFWLNFSIIKMQLWPRLLAGETELLDALIGFPLVLALAIVVYAVVFWAIKLVIILTYPQWLTLPPEADEVEFDPSRDDDFPSDDSDNNTPPKS